jgi:hypothetical protein
MSGIPAIQARQILPIPRERRGGADRARTSLGLAAGGSLLVVTLACVQYKDGDRLAGPVAWPAGSLQVEPISILVAVGQVTRFTATGPVSGRVLWSVAPAAAGIIDANGVFSPSGTIMQCSVVAAWSQDTRVKGSASVTVFAAPLPANIRPDLVEAAGGLQTGAAGAIINELILDEGAVTGTSTGAGGTIQVRHGFYPTVGGP